MATEEMTHKVRTKFFLSIALAAVCLTTSAVCRAQAQSDAGSVAGAWHFVLDTEGGPRDLDATFQVDGDKVSGKWSGQDVKGTFAAGKLSLEFPFNSDEAGAGTMKIEGKLDRDAITGNWSFQTYDGSFKATRTKPAAQ